MAKIIETNEHDEETVAAAAVELEQFMARSRACEARGVSWCCEAPIANLRGLVGGPRDGHGVRKCSKCGQELYVV